MGTINRKISRFDITAVYSHPSAKVDIVLVHGLNGDPQRTWTAKSPNGNGAFWPVDLLPKSLEAENAHANVLVYGYNADVSSKKHGTGPSSNYIHQHAQTLVTFLTTYRKSKKTTRNPIIWVAHSLGGILVKRALEHSDSVRVADHEDYRSIYVSTYGIIFLGTPHDGSELASWGSALQGMAGHVPRKFFDSEPVLIETLRKDNETLDNININFLNIYQRFKIQMVHENQKTDLKGTKSLIVDAKSAAPRLPGVTSYGVEADHSNMCKFAGFDAPGYRTISTAIAEWVQAAPDVTSVRWNVEDDGRRVRAQLEMNERARPFLAQSGSSSQVAGMFQVSETPTLSSPSSGAAPFSIEPAESHDAESPGGREALFIHPEAFRPNSYFVGRKEELDDLHRMLQDKRRRSEGGIFWLRATSVQELEGEFWRVARTAALKDLMDKKNYDELRDNTKIIDIVREWFNGFEGWLMILDGIMFDSPGIERFVPDVANSSIILTSTDPAATGNHHFNNPQLLPLPLLPAQEAQELLLLETEKRKPWGQEDLSQATELVQILGRLPLMIHFISQQIKANQEPLATFLKRYRTRPKVGKVPAYEYVLEQLQSRGATAALNVMSILVFFDQNIPVEMMALGLHALGKEIPYKTRDASTHGKGSLSNTLRVLIAFALVERTETQDVSPTSSRSSRQSFPIHSESLDTLRIHSVIQRYFIESLAGKGQHAYWLERTVEVFSKSYDEADRRISEQPKVGLPDDYRRFYIHGKKLAEHLKRYERRHSALQPLRKEIETKLEEIHDKIHGLSGKIQAMIVDQSDEIAQTSIFDRTNSLSESDSATSSSQSQSQQDSWARMDEDDPRLYNSPVAFAPGQQYDAYGMPFPYPDGSTIPAEPYHYEDEHERTPQITPKVGQGSPDLDQNGWTTVVPVHQSNQRPRTDSLINQRGHHKSDSEIGVSHGIARPPFFHTSSPRGGSRSSSKGRLSVHSEAELALQKVRKVSPPGPRGGRAVQDKGRSLSSGTTTRPRDIMTRGENNYARVASGLTPTDKPSPAEFYRGSGGKPLPGSSWTAETVKRFKEGLKPTGRKSSTGSSNSRTAPTPGSVHTSPGAEEVATMPPFPQVTGTRTARSSPGGVTPFYPPSLPVERMTGDGRRNPPPNFHQWNTSSYTPGLGRLEPLNLPRGQQGLDQDPNALPYPFPPNVWFPAPEAVSAPMSRNSSQQSSNQSSTGRRRGANLALATSATALRGRRHSSPLSSPIGSAPPPGSRFPARGHSRPPSVVTEPSPRLRPRYEVPELPAGQARVYLPEPLPRPGAGSNTPGTGTGTGTSASASGNGTPPVRPRWYKRASGRLRGRAQSQSPSVGLRVSSGGASVHSAGSPDPGSAGDGGSEAMARSGSGGIVVGDGKIIGFGELPVNMELAREAVSAPPMSRSSSGGVGLGIMHETE
ncbi:hypothetical protein INS49_013826 [Diaporthe citri]|uniref:uncharacterized protein n=1 Tax=Diaporthe citri TaxID=83186 RepID=UPI001C814012|nr:uncharacterized protein INS49_013826 [Diaporthe citri]KAG6357943.1 hypothetical protein INS49_013826 [Diaporthe citri]